MTTDLAIAAGTGLVHKKDSNLLAKMGARCLNSKLGTSNGFHEEKGKG